MNESPTPAEGSGGTRQHLLDAARSCVRERGIAGATSREITKAAGANLAAITYHFGSKDELIAEALFGELERRVTPALTAFDGDGEPTELMLHAMQQLLAEFERSKGETVVYLEALHLATHDPQYRERAVGLYRSIRDHLSALVQELIDAGTIPGWVVPDVMASLVLAVANGIVLQSQLDPDGPDHSAMAGQFASLLLAAAQQNPTDRRS